MFQVQRIFAVLVITFFAAMGSSAQVSDLRTISSAEVNAAIEKGLPGFTFPKATAPIAVKKVVYSTTGTKGERQNVSGILILPQKGTSKGLVVYMHGTTWDFKNAPSRVVHKLKPGSAEPLAFAAAGYAVAMPDYIGLGDSTGYHPYPLNIVNGRSGVDIVAPARNYARRSGYALGDKLFVTGYCEGGGTAMGMVKLIEESGDASLKITRAAPASGPYDLTGVTRDYLLADVAGDDILIRAFLLGYTISYFKHDLGVNTDDYFTKTMARTVNANFKRGRSDKMVGLGLVIMGKLSGGTRSRDHLLTPRFISALETLDRSDPVIKYMSENNVHDWAPRTEMLLISLATDKVVDPRNATVAMKNMRRRGVSAHTLRHLEIHNDKLEHGTASIQATYETLRFFENGFAAVPNSK